MEKVRRMKRFSECVEYWRRKKEKRKWEEERGFIVLGLGLHHFLESSDWRVMQFRLWIYVLRLMTTVPGALSERHGSLRAKPL